MIKKLLILLLLFGLICLSFFMGLTINNNRSNSFVYETKPYPTENPKILSKYQIENLNQGISSGNFTFFDTKKEEGYSSSLFRYSFDPGKNGSIKETSGLINIPEIENESKFPIVILIRGYVDQQIYTTGVGSKNIGLYLVENGYITIAPDFLGYADSDTEASDVFESRFQTYTTILSLIKTIEEGGVGAWDGKNIFIWGHSNGGQIALTVLEASQKNIPTVLWAPVTKPFPYSILYYTDESVDGGKFIRSELSKFENVYDTDKFSLSNYLDRIKANIQLHQGTADNAVPTNWSDEFNSKLKSADIDIEFFKYSGADHNLRPSWDVAAARSLEFFSKNLK